MCEGVWRLHLYLAIATERFSCTKL